MRVCSNQLLAGSALGVLLCLLLSGSVLAQESALTFLERAYGKGKVSGLRQSGDWAFCNVVFSPEGEGQALIHRHLASWETATAGGGALSARELATYGVPRSSWDKLLGRKPTEEELAGAREVLSAPYWTWLTRDRVLTNSDLENYSALELTLMRNEVFALHGRVFQDPFLKSVFASRTWYRPNPKFSEALLSQQEKANVSKISAFQKKNGKV